MDPKKILQVQNSLLQSRIERMDELFPETKSITAIPVIIVPRNQSEQSNSILSKQVLIEFSQLRKRIAQLEAVSSVTQRVVTLNDICYKLGASSAADNEDFGTCYSPSVMAYWKDNATRLWNDKDHLKTMSYKLKTSIGGSIDPSDLIGGISWNSVHSRIEMAQALSFSITFATNDTDMFSTWESQFIHFTSNINQNETYSFRVLIQSDSMLEKEIERTFYKIGPLFVVGVIISAVIVFTSFIYMRSSKTDSIVIRLLIACFGIYLVIGSISCSIVICQLVFGYSMTPLSAHALPLFLVGIGVDGLFLYQS